MNPEEVFEKLIKNQISRAEFEQLLAGLDDEDILARYEVFLQTQFEEEVEKHFSKLEYLSEAFIKSQHINLLPLKLVSSRFKPLKS